MQRSTDNTYHSDKDDEWSYLRGIFANSEPIVKSLDDYKSGQTFEQLVIGRFEKYHDESEAELIKRFEIPATNEARKFYLISKTILGVSKEIIEEFYKADIAMRKISLTKTGSVKRGLSFGHISLCEIADEEWEESYLCERLTKRFFFVIFQFDPAGELRLKKVMFWAMPVKDLETARGFWEDTKAKIANDDYEHFIKQSDERICFARTKATDSHDLMPTPAGGMQKKLGYWLSSGYIKKVIDEA